MFSYSCDCMQVANGKPAPDVFLAAAQQLGVPASSCLCFEDAPSGVQVGCRFAQALVAS